MPETSQLPGSTPTEHNIIGPDYFGFYRQKIAEFLSQDEDHLPFFPHNSSFEGEGSLTKNCCTSTENCDVTVTAPLFSDAMGVQLSDFRKEGLRALVCQSLFAFTQEVNEIVDPITQICRVQTLLRSKRSMLRLPGGTLDSSHEHSPQKRQKTHSSACSMELRPEEGSPPVKELNGQLYLEANVGTVNEKEIDHDLLFLLDHDYTKVEEMTKKHSDELFALIRHMEQKLEEFIDILVSKCRSMTLHEKQQLLKLIQELPPTNLDRVVEIIQRHKPIDRYSSDDIYVDLEKEDNATLWRLYFYVVAFKKAGNS